jgi:tetratricopeptide (TPR) repeat protein
VIKRVALFEGRSISIGRNLSFHPVIDLLKQWASIREDDGEAMAYGKLEAAVKNLHPDKVGDIFPFVATLMGMKLSGRYAKRIEGIEGEALEKLILKNIRELLIKATELAPLMIVMEDMHWSDLSSIQLLESLFRLAETQRILFVNVLRPGYSQTGDRIIETVNEKLHVYSVEIILEPLNEKMSEVLITNVLNINVLRRDIIRQIVKRAGGNPFFIEEVARSLIDEQAVVLKDGEFQITEKIGTIAIPNTINDVLMARIDRLEEETRNLVKIASVIGRNFFYKVLSEAASTIKNIDSRLSYLKEIQLFRKRSRMDEVEYLFKHALAQETAYESILPRKRRELHLKVAASIEKVFKERLYEFFGMLAYHYSRAENLDKAEKYLIKAGEEALKSSASNEALHYYQEAFNLYRDKYGDQADPEKVAMFEKNIAIALYNRGQYIQAVKYFDKALNYYCGEFPKYTILKIIKCLSGISSLIFALYFPSLKFKKIPTQRDIEILDLSLKECKVLSITNPRRFFIESFYFIKTVADYDLAKFGLGLEIFIGASALFSFTGISYGLSKKILDSVKEKIADNAGRQLILYDLLEVQQCYFSGNWKAIKAYDDDLVSQNLSIGEIYFASQHLFWHGLANIYQGSLHVVELIINRLNQIYELYQNDMSLMLKQLLNSNYLMECRNLRDAFLEIDEGINFAQKIGYGLSLIHMYSCHARINILQGDIEKAKKSLRKANSIRCEVNSVPWQLSQFFKSQTEYHLYRLKESILAGNKKKALKYRKNSIKSCKKLLKNSHKVAQHRTESYSLMGKYYWFIKNQKEALKWWNKSIEEGQRLNAQLELARTYLEVGKRLSESESKIKALNGIEAKEYLEHAGVLFEEMNLQTDLNELSQMIR